MTLALQALGEVGGVVPFSGGQAVPELLDSDQVARAQEFYRSQPKRYTPAVMEQLHQHFDLPASAEPTVGLVKSVAVRQKQRGLRVDGMAGPRTLPELFPSGLLSQESAEAYAATANSVETEWDRSPLPALRAVTIVAGANDRLAAANVPICQVDVNDLGGHVAGLFEHESWHIHVDDDLVRGPAVDPTTGKSRVRPAMGTVYHEARHAEQWFSIARMVAGRSPKPLDAELAARTKIPIAIAQRALDSPIAPGTMEAAIAEGWFDAELGAQKVETESARRQADDAQVEADKAEKLARDQPTEANLARAALARKRANVLFAIYKNVPTEGDAFRAQAKVEAELAQV
jgi:hypothetical protein